MNSFSYKQLAFVKFIILPRSRSGEIFHWSEMYHLMHEDNLHASCKQPMHEFGKFRITVINFSQLDVSVVSFFLIIRKNAV